MGKQYGLIGAKLGHSYSPRIHAALGTGTYNLYELPEHELEGFLKSGRLAGANVTIPYKKTVMRWCTSLSDAAQAIGSVNTLLFGPDGSIHGHNTDYDGFVWLVGLAGIELRDKKVLVLGTGGTSLTVCYAARSLGAREVVTVSRTGPNNYENLHLHADTQVLINTTPVGMYPENGGAPVSLDRFPACEGVLDVIYNPLQTRLVLDARARGIRASGGLPMLVAQAASASALFQERALEPEQSLRVLRQIEAETRNIVLIGMPGSGKTSIGQELARLTGRPLLDTDQMVVEQAGIEIPRIFEERKEAGFRALEREAVARAGATVGKILATGGGAVLAAENRLSLAQNGLVFWIRRPLEQLATAGRPLSVDLEALYQARQPVYEQAADYCVDNVRTPAKAAQEIWTHFRKYDGM